MEVRKAVIGNNSEAARALAAKQVLNSLRWDGKNKNFSFEMFVGKFLEQIQAIEDAGQVIDPIDKVDRFIAAIKEPMIASSISTSTANNLEIGKDLHKLIAWIRTVLNAETLRTEGLLKPVSGEKRNISSILPRSRIF